MKHQQSLPLFTLHSSLFTLRVQKGTGTHRRLAWRAGGPPRRSDHLRKISPLVAATSHTLHSSLFTLHSSDFERGWVPVWLGPGRLVGWWGCSLISARPRDHTLHSSLFTLHSSRSERDRDPQATGLEGWRAAAPTATISAKSRHSSQPRHTPFTLHSSLFTLHSSDFERERVPVCNEPGGAHEFGDQSFLAPPPPPAAVQVPGRGGRAGATSVLLTFAQKYVCRLDRDQRVSIRVTKPQD